MMCYRLGNETYDVPEEEPEKICLDEDDGTELDTEKVNEGVTLELEQMDKLDVADECPRAEVPANETIWKGRWCHRRKAKELGAGTLSSSSSETSSRTPSPGRRA